jgi:hypothetical protein
MFDNAVARRQLSAGRQCERFKTNVLRPAKPVAVDEAKFLDRSQTRALLDEGSRKGALSLRSRPFPLY